MVSELVSLPTTAGLTHISILHNSAGHYTAEQVHTTCCFYMICTIVPTPHSESYSGSPHWFDHFNKSQLQRTVTLVGRRIQ